ncbi:AGE family epimerase/isomerase [Vibrio astriarenae]|uniref:N-acylglucosamine 2-epimerase n=1 Tax=Vibrio astriarenae TaxID=1481923 RepID=UPI003736C013
MHFKSLLPILAISTFSCQAIAQSQPDYHTMLPNGDAWLTHADKGLSPYWMTLTAQGSPLGNFPTFRCDNGDVLNIDAPCAELANHSWIKAEFGRDYTRMKSRQIYAYGVRYHLTGDPEALALAKAGVDYLLQELRDEKNDGYITYREQGNPGLKWQQRTSQDQAYAIVGLAFYYYLTRDPAVEQALIEQQAFIFDKYRTQANDQLLWVLEDSDVDKKVQLELVAQLDQINGYLLLVMPLLPEPHQAKWREDLEWLTKQMLALYHDDDEWRFYGAIHHPAVMKEGAKHNDFGHTIKAYWMTYLTGQALDNQEWQSFAQKGMQNTLERAAFSYPKTNLQTVMSEDEYNAIPFEEIYSWKSETYNYGISAWQWAELDQALMTLAIKEGNKFDKSWTRQLFFTTTTFHQYWVDHQYGGVGMMPKSVKQFQWGNGYHQFEHALVGYISAQSWYDEPATLYYALPKDSQFVLQPYYFTGKEISRKITEQDLKLDKLQQVAVAFKIE